jgi:aspartyl protease family protein
MIGWALRSVLLCCGLVLVGVMLLGRISPLLQQRGAPSGSAAPETAAARSAPDTIAYPANAHGHVVLEAVVNGSPVRMLVDTGASLVTLTQKDARAAGIAPGELIFNGRVETASGFARMAPVTIREIRIGQFSVYDVPAGVLENLSVSLLGMSFLSRLQSYQMSDGKLTITW